MDNAHGSGPTPACTIALIANAVSPRARGLGASLNGPRDFDLGGDPDGPDLDGNVDLGRPCGHIGFTIGAEPIPGRTGDVADRSKLHLRGLRENLRLTYRIFDRFGLCLVGELFGVLQPEMHTSDIGGALIE